MLSDGDLMIIVNVGLLVRLLLLVLCEHLSVCCFMSTGRCRIVLWCGLRQVIARRIEFTIFFYFCCRFVFPNSAVYVAVKVFVVFCGEYTGWAMLNEATPVPHCIFDCNSG